MGLKDLNKKLQLLIEQEVEDIDVSEEPQKEVEGENVVGPDIEGEQGKDLNEIIRVTESLRTKCESLASLLPETSKTREILIQIAKNAMESYRILNDKKIGGIDSETLMRVAKNAMKTFRILNAKKSKGFD
jgi:hypothetical protein